MRCGLGPLVAGSLVAVSLVAGSHVAVVFAVTPLFRPIAAAPSRHLVLWTAADPGSGSMAWWRRPQE